MRSKVIRLRGLLVNNKRCLSLLTCNTASPYHILSFSYRYPHATLTFSCKRHYSEKVKGSLTDEILQDRVVKIQPENKQDSSNRSDDTSQQKDEKPKGFHVMGKFISHTAFGFWMFGVSMGIIGLTLVQAWGKMVKNNRSPHVLFFLKVRVYCIVKSAVQFIVT